MINKLGITSDFGEVRSNYVFLKKDNNGKKVFIDGKHEGIDFMSSLFKKQRIFSETFGIIDDMRYLKDSYGNRLLIKSELSKFGDNFKDEYIYCLYGHLDRFGEGLKVGDEIKRGDFIGYMGNTGYCLTKMYYDNNILKYDGKYRRVTEEESRDEKFYGGVHLHFSIFTDKQVLFEKIKKFCFLKVNDYIYQFNKFWLNPLKFLNVYNNFYI